MKPVALLTLSKYKDLFDTLNESTKILPPMMKVLMRTGTDVGLPQSWHIFSPEPPFNYAKYANLGIHLSGGDILLVNDDVEFTDPKTVELLQEAAYSDPEIGIVSPKIIGGGQTVQTQCPDGKVFTTGHFLAFVCVYIKREVIKAVGMLDEQFDGYGMEDVDYCVRVRQEGYKLAVTSKTSVKHGAERQHSNSFFRAYGAQYGAKGNDARAKFIAKWGNNPMDIWGESLDWGK